MLSTSYLRVSRSIISTTSWEYRSFKQRRTDVPRGGMTGGAGCQTVRGPVKPRRASGSARRESCRMGGGDGGGRGGLTGISTAWHLAERAPGLGIVVLEARRLGNGASGRNGGQVLHWVNGVSTADPGRARRVYAVTGRGIDIAE